MFGVVFLAGCGYQPKKEDYSPQTTSTLEKTNQEVTKLGNLKLNIPPDLKAIKSSHIVESVGSQFSAPDNLNTFSWVVVPKDFKGTDMDLFPSQNNVSFATLLIRKEEDGDKKNGAADINKILDLTGGEYPDGFVTSYTLVKQELIGKNVSNDDVYGYEYLVNEAENKKLKLQPARKFIGVLWIHDKNIYILQDQTQVSAWSEKKINKTNSTIQDRIQSIALSAKVEE